MYKIRPIAELTKLTNNPRTITQDDFAKLCNSIKNNPKFFAAKPLILSNRTGELVIIAGNMRYNAAQHLGLKEVPTFLIEGLTEEEEQEITFKDNTHSGNFDWEIVANEFEIDLLVEWGVSLPVDFSALYAEDVKVVEKKPTRYGLTIETEIKENLVNIKSELEKKKIKFKEWEK